MTYNYLFVNEILKGLTYCDKNKFCNETFVSTAKLKGALENEISKEIFLKNGLKNLKLPRARTSLRNGLKIIQCFTLMVNIIL